MPTDYELEVDELQAIVRRDHEAFTRWFTKEFGHAPLAWRKAECETHNPLQGA